MALANLPGFAISIKDGNLTPAQVTPTTASIMIIGTALDGPVNQPIAINKLSIAEGLFGPLVYKGSYLNPNSSTADGRLSGNNLIQAMYEVFNGGGGNLILCRVGGEFATAKPGASGVLSFQSFYPSAVYNGVTVTVGASAVTVANIPVEKGGSTLSYSTVGKNIDQLVNEINADSSNSVITVSCANSAKLYLDATTTLNAASATGTAALSGGTFGNTAVGDTYGPDKGVAGQAALWGKLNDTDGTFDTVEGYGVDIVYLAAINADTCVSTGADAATNSPASGFATFCHMATKNNYPTIGVIGLGVLGDTTVTGVKDYVNNNLEYTGAAATTNNGTRILMGPIMKSGFTYADDELGNVDIGKYLSVVAGPDVVTSQKDIGTYRTSPASFYAGKISATKPQDGTTWKKLMGPMGMAYNFTQRQRSTLSGGVGQLTGNVYSGGGAYVTFFNEAGVGITCQSAVTAAKRDSDFVRLSTLRITNAATVIVRRVCFPFIGNANTIEAHNAMRTEIKASLDGMGDSGALNGSEGTGYRFSLSSNTAEAVLGEVNVELELMPAFELRLIRITVGVS